MLESTLLAQAAQDGGDPFMVLVLQMGVVVLIFYFIWFRPMTTKQKKHDEMVKALAPGAKVIINPGIFGTIVGVEDDAFLVRVDDKTRLKVLKTAVSTVLEDPKAKEKTEKK